MKIKHNSKSILIIVSVLILFSSVVIWHDKPPKKLKLKGRIDLINRLSLNNEGLVKFISQHDMGDAFYSIGMEGNPWPVDLSRACYPDPITARWQFSQVGDAYSKPIQVYRYRSMLDFLDLLYVAEQENPGTLAGLDFNNHLLRKENALALSVRSISASLLALLGLIIVGKVKPRN